MKEIFYHTSCARAQFFFLKNVVEFITGINFLSTSTTSIFLKPETSRPLQNSKPPTVLLWPPTSRLSENADLSFHGQKEYLDKLHRRATSIIEGYKVSQPKVL